MDDDDRESNASSENEQDEVMEDVDEVENDNDVDNEAEEDDNEEEEEQAEADADIDADADADDEPEQEPDIDETQDATQPDGPPDAADGTGEAAAGSAATDARMPPTTLKEERSPSARPVTPRFRPTVRPEAVTARLYDIVPTMAAPMATSINALAVTPDLRYWMTGGTDGYIRKYDGVGTINGKLMLTVAQRHPFVDSVTKAGILMSYWENEEPPTAPRSALDEHVLSPVYSLAVHSRALWLLSGLESGGINLQSVRHDEGKRIHCLREGGHTNAVSVLTLAPDEKSVLSGSWDKQVIDWDLNTGQVIRQFEGSGGQISALELRPASGAPIPAEASELDTRSETMVDNNDQSISNGFSENDLSRTTGRSDGPGQVISAGAVDAPESPAHESLFGSPAGSLFGDNEPMGGGAFGGDEDDEFSRAMDMTLHDEPAHEASSFSAAGDNALAAAPEAGQAPDAQADAPGQAPDGAASTLPNGDIEMSNGDVSHDTAVTSQQPPYGEMAGNSSLPDQQFDTSIPAPDAPPNNMAQTDLQPTQTQAPASPSMLFTSAADPNTSDPNQTSTSTFFSASMDGTIRIWDRRVRDPVARIKNRPGVPPWCMGASWSPDGNWIYAGRRNGTVEEFNIHKARSGWAPERVLKFPNGSGPVSCVRPMPNGRHLVCASHDILRLYDLRDTSAFKGSAVPFLIIPGPPRAGVISSLYIDPTARFMLSAAGNRGWEGSTTECLIGYEISVTP